MKIKIYQINAKRDLNRLMFENTNVIKAITGTDNVDAKIYDLVYVNNNMPETDLDGIFYNFNYNRPKDFRGRSLSVSDVIGIENAESMKTGYYFVNNFGFKKIEFDAELSQISDKINNPVKQIKVLYITPHKAPEIITINDNLDDLQNIVGGHIEIIHPYDDNVAIVCNEEGKILGLPLNRAIYTNMQENSRNMIDIIAGPFIIVGTPEWSEEFESLDDEQIKKYYQLYKTPLSNQESSFDDMEQI